MIRRLGLLACVVAMAAACGTSSSTTLSSSRATLEAQAAPITPGTEQSPASAVPDVSSAAAPTPAPGSHEAALDSETKPYIVRWNCTD